MYTEKEYCDLVEQSPSFNLINDINFILVTNGTIYRKKLLGVKQHINHNYPNFYKLMYELKLKDVPLFINNKLPIVRVIALWRLRIGK